MTLKHYLIHLLFWLRTFPRWSMNEHTTFGPAGSGHYICVICDYDEVEEAE